MKLKKFFSKINIQITFSFLAFSLGIVISLSVIFYYSASKILLDNREKQTTESIAQTSDYVASYLDKIKTLSNLIAMYPQISEILENPSSKSADGLFKRLPLFLRTGLQLPATVIWQCRCPGI